MRQERTVQASLFDLFCTGHEIGPELTRKLRVLILEEAAPNSWVMPPLVTE